MGQLGTVGQHRTAVRRKDHAVGVVGDGGPDEPSVMRTRVNADRSSRSNKVPAALTQKSSAPDTRAERFPPEPTTRPARTTSLPQE
jgi:hypothetical protein